MKGECSLKIKIFMLHEREGIGYSAIEMFSICTVRYNRVRIMYNGPILSLAPKDAVSTQKPRASIKSGKSHNWLWLSEGSQAQKE